MGLLWPAYLLLLATLPLVVLAYVLVLRRRRRFAVHYSSLSLIRQAMPPGIRWRRHLPFVLIVLALGAAILSAVPPVCRCDGCFKPNDRHAGAGRFAEHVRQ